MVTNQGSGDISIINLASPGAPSALCTEWRFQNRALAPRLLRFPSPSITYVTSLSLPIAAMPRWRS